MKKLNVKTIVFAAVLVAMNLVLSRVLAINIGSTLRITVSATPIYLASLWFGPLVGGIVGSLGFTVVGLHVYYATPWSVLYATRVIQTIALTIANTILVSVLYQSALTTYVNQVFALQRTREV